MTCTRHAQVPAGTRFLASILLLGGSLSAVAMGTAQAQTGGTSAQDQTGSAVALERLRREIANEEAKLQKTRLELEHQQAVLERQGALLDAQLRQLRGAGTTGTAAAEPASQTVAQAPAPAAPPQAPGSETSAPITGKPAPSQPEQRVLQTSPLQSVGGVLTPRGRIVLDPSLEYDYYDTNRLTLNGFTILPGITFGQILIAKQKQNVLTPALTVRYGITDRLEINLKIPYVYAYGETITQSVLNTNSGNGDVLVLTPSGHASSIGDIQFGASYQFNSAASGEPIFVGNMLVKTNTGTSPFNVPIYTVNDPNGGYIAGIQRQVPTRPGFWAIEPNLPVLYPAAPGVLFRHPLYLHNFAANVEAQSLAGGPPSQVNAKPGDAVALTFGIGFALNDQATFTFSYQQEHVWAARLGDVSVKGSDYDFGTFNFGIGYQIAKNTSLNIGVGIGAGPNAPAAKILIDVPITF